MSRATAWARRAMTIAGLVLVVGSVPAAAPAQEATDPDGFVGYQAAASGTALTAFPTVPALLPVEVPVEATVGLATATISSGGQGFGRASTFFPGTLTTGVRPLIEVAAGVRLPLPDYPIVVEAREFEEAKHTDVPGVTMDVDVDPGRAVAVADAGAVGVPAIVGVQSLRTESRTTLEGGKVVATSTATVSGIDVLGVLRIGSVVSTASVSSDGKTSTCTGGVTISGVTVGGTAAILDDDGLRVDQQTALPGLGLGRAITDALAASGLQVQVLGGDSACDTASGSRTTSGVLIGFPLPELGSIPAGGGFRVVVGSTSASAGGSSLPPDDVVTADVPPAFGDVVTRLPGPFTGGGVLPPVVTPGTIGGGDAAGFPMEDAAYSFAGVPLSLLVGLLLLAVVASARVTAVRGPPHRHDRRTVTDPRDPRGATVVDPTAPTELGAPRRERFRTAVGRLAERSSSTDLIRWMLIPGSLCVLLGLVAIVLGWVGAARTAREIEQIPYLISGGVLGLALVVLGGLLLASTFWVAVLRKLQQEAEQRATAGVAELEARVTAIESAPRPTRRRAG